MSTPEPASVSAIRAACFAKLRY